MPSSLDIALWFLVDHMAAGMMTSIEYTDVPYPIECTGSVNPTQQCSCVGDAAPPPPPPGMGMGKNKVIAAFGSLSSPASSSPTATAGVVALIVIVTLVVAMSVRTRRARMAGRNAPVVVEEEMEWEDEMGTNAEENDASKDSSLILMTKNLHELNAEVSV